MAEERPGGADALCVPLEGAGSGVPETSYRPVVAIFGMSAAMAVAIAWAAPGPLLSVRVRELSAAVATCVLSIQEPWDVEGFAAPFRGPRPPRGAPAGLLRPLSLRRGRGGAPDAGQGALDRRGAARGLRRLGGGRVGDQVGVRGVARPELRLRLRRLPGAAGFVSLTETPAMMAMGLSMGAETLAGREPRPAAGPRWRPIGRAPTRGCVRGRCGPGWCPSPPVSEVVEELSLDAERLIEDMRSPGIDAALDLSGALASLLDLPGTPALVVGRTVVLGAVRERGPTRIVAEKRAVRS